MKILKEAKEKLPIDFITQYISKGWEEVGTIKASIDAIKQNFTDTKDVSEILQDLSDAYLIAIGQLQGILQDKKYVDIPEEAKDNLKESLTEELPDAKVLGLDKSEEKVEEPAPVEKETLAPELPEEDISDEDVKEALNEDVIINITDTDKDEEAGEAFAYFCDFDDPEPDGENLHAQLADQGYPFVK